MKNQLKNFQSYPTIAGNRNLSAVIAAPGKIEFKFQALTPPTGNEIVIQTIGVGMCASTLPLWEGREWFNYPLAAGVPGHEGWGRIVEVGLDVDTFEIGQIVAFLANNSFSEYVTVPFEDAVLLPEFMEDMDFPGEPFGCLMNILERADIKEGQTVAIIGLGFLGQGLVELLAQRNVKVIGISRRNSNLEMAKDADLKILMDDHWKIIEAVKKYTNGKGCERVIECTGKQWPLDIAGDIISEYGKLIIAGYHQDGLRQINLQQWNWKAIDVINAHERSSKIYKQGIVKAIEAISSGELNPDRLITHRFSFEELPDAFQILGDCPEGYIKGVIKFNV